MKHFLTSLIVAIAVVLVALNTPVRWYDVSRWFGETRLGTAFTTLTSADQLSAFPTTYNANLTLTANLTAANAFSALNTFTQSSSTMFSCYGPCYFGGSATSSFASTGALTLITPLTTANGGTGSTSFTSNSLIFYNGSALVSTSSNPLYVDAIVATSSTRFSGFATSTPWALLSINPNGISGPSFAIGSSTRTLWLTTNGGQSRSCESVPATSTSMTVNFGSSCNQVLVQAGTAGITLTLSGGTIGDTKRLVICNPNDTAGAITWASSPANLILWSAGAAPALTTTANKCNVVSFVVTQSTSTTNTSLRYFGAGNTGF